MTQVNEGEGSVLTAEQIAEIVRERDEAKANLSGIVEEVKSLRTKTQELKSALEAKPTDPVDETETKIAQVLAQRDAQAAQVVRERAWNKFIESNKEFHPDNDVAGIKLNALKNKLARFNLNGLSSEDEFNAVFEDAVGLLNKGSGSSSGKNASPYASTPSGAGATVPQPVDQLNDKERSTLSSLGWTQEKFLDFKKKHPELVSKLLNN